MMTLNPSRRLSGRGRKIARGLRNGICALVAVLVAIAAYLGIFGVPRPILERIVQDLNENGIHVDIERLHLTWRGWKATNVSYYSENPDDLSPLFQSNEIILHRSRVMDGDQACRRGYDIHFREVILSPSADWVIGLPPDSRLREVKHLSVSLGFNKNSIIIRNGALSWCGVLFHAHGKLVAAPPATQEGKPIFLPDFFPLIITPQVNAVVDRVLNMLAQSDTAVVDVDFLINAGDLSANHAKISAKLAPFQIQQVVFSQADLVMTYRHPQITLEHVALSLDNAELSLSGTCDAVSRELQLQIINSITSRQMYDLVPWHVMQFLAFQGLSLGSFPELEAHLGPSQPEFLLQKIDGSFMIDDVTFRSLHLPSVTGRVARHGSRMDITELHADALGQEERAAETGSCMAGGEASGKIFWDSDAHTFGVTAEGSFDPNLLVLPLADIRIATNIIQRFRFNASPPSAHVELGACYDDWHSFYFRLRGSGRDMFFQDVLFSLINTTVSYSNGKLTIDPLLAKQGIDYVKGSASLDFYEDIASFDGVGSINPATIENVVYPRYDIFSDEVKVVGPAKISARGSVDWHSMQATDFMIEVECPRMELPFIALDRLRTTVIGAGTRIQCTNTVFEAYGGPGEGLLTMWLDPATQGVPYEIDLAVRNADFKQGLDYLYPNRSNHATGEFFGRLHARADFSSSFFESANGTGKVAVKRGQLADLPLFRAFSSVMRKLIPSFGIFSIQNLSCDFELRDGVVYSDNAYFDGELLSAKGRGSYSAQSGFDAHVQAQILSDNNFSRIFRFFTDPIFKFFEMKLEGTLAEPEWKLGSFMTE